MKTVKLTDEEVATCFSLATKLTEHIERKYKNSTVKLTNEDTHARSFCAQYAYSKLLGEPRYPEVTGQETNKEVFKASVSKTAGHSIRVASKSWHSLIVRPNDEDHVNIVLAICEKPDEVKFVGYKRAAEAKRREYFASYLPIPGYIVSQRDLKPIEELLPKET